MNSPEKRIQELDYRQTILLVDDRPENIASLEALLDDGRRELLSAINGERALQLALLAGGLMVLGAGATVLGRRRRPTTV